MYRSAIIALKESFLPLGEYRISPIPEQRSSVNLTLYVKLVWQHLQIKGRTKHRSLPYKNNGKFIGVFSSIANGFNRNDCEENTLPLRSRLWLFL
jgi:hypothetical protein